MKIRVRFTDKCLVIQTVAAKEFDQFYMTLEEFERVLANGSGTFDDCGEICMVRTEQLIFVENVAYKYDLEGSVKFLRVPMDCRKFFARVKDLRDRGFIKTEFVTLDSESFQFKREPAVTMTFNQILRNELFKAREKLFSAVGKVATEQLFKLREEISRILGQGKVIVPDYCDYSFYFYPPDGKGYNGGIIYHQNTGSYSVHT